MVDNLQTKIKVRGRIAERKIKLADDKEVFYYELQLYWPLGDGKRGRKAKLTDLLVYKGNTNKKAGNQTRADDMLDEFIKEQQAFLDSQVHVVQTQEKLYASKTTFADFIEHNWLEAVRRGDRKANKRKVALGTFGGYQMNVVTHIAPHFRESGVLLQDISHKDINAFYDAQYERIVKNTGELVKAETVLKYHANIVSALKYAMKKDYIDSADRILKNVERPDPEEFEAKPYNKAEALALIEAVRGHTLELCVIIGAYYGLRRSECVGLRWESLDMEANTITIEHSVTVTSVDGKRVIDAKDKMKNKSSFRTLPLVPILRAKLLEVKAEQERNRKLCGRSYNRTEGDVYIIVDALGNRMNPDYITSAFPEFLKKKGLRRIRFHDLRHTSARLLLAAGIPREKIMPWLGHSSYAMTSRYAKFDKSVNVESAERLDWIEETSLAENVSEKQDEVES